MKKKRIRSPNVGIGINKSIYKYIRGFEKFREAESSQFACKATFFLK